MPPSATTKLVELAHPCAVAILAMCLGASAAEPPYPRSPVIRGVTFVDSTSRIEAPGSDNWPITWAANGHLYTSFGDGGGFGGTNSDSRVSLGIARVEGGKDDYRGSNIAGGKKAPYPAPFLGKSEGILAIGDVLYLWRDGNGSDERAFASSQLWRSDDLGASWKFTGVEFSKKLGHFPKGDEGFFALTFCQFGRGYDGARDGFVYIYGPEISDRSHWDVQKPGKIALLRVARHRLDDRAAYEFFAGTGPSGSPTWTRQIAGRKPVWEDLTNGTHRMAVSYNPGLKRYLLTTMTVDRLGHLAIYDAPEPWGPWTTVLFEQDRERWGSKVVVFNFVNKWLSADGRRFVLVYTKNDHWASLEGKFLTDRRK
jgi:hypothetical protein